MCICNIKFKTFRNYYEENNNETQCQILGRNATLSGDSQRTINNVDKHDYNDEVNFTVNNDDVGGTWHPYPFHAINYL